jgi:ferredoxin
LEADLVINLPKLKTHALTLYTGAVKNLFGAIPGTRKREIHYRAPGVQDFSVALADVLELVPTGLTIMDGIVGQEGSGPGVGGTPHHYGCLLASRDGVALDSVVTHAMGYRSGDVLHLAEAAQRGLGDCDLKSIEVKGDPGALEFGKLDLPSSHWYLRIPSWMAAPIRRVAERRPLLRSEACIGCGRCVEVCPRDAITVDETAHIDLDECVSCLCCAEICPQGAIEPHQGLLGRLLSSF